MPKSAVINLQRDGLLEKVQFKKLALFFDSLHIELMALTLSKWDIERTDRFTEEEKQIFLKEIDWLCDQGIIKTYRFAKNDFLSANFPEELSQDIQSTDRTVHDNIIPLENDEIDNRTKKDFRLAGVLRADNGLIFKMEDIRMRVDAAVLSSKDRTTDFIPIVNSFDSYQQIQSSLFATHFILDKLPTPSINTPWEQLFDFRNDENTKRKYYSLINWINTISQKDQPFSHIVDQYNQLYSEYIHQYSLHKLDSDYTNIEVLILTGVDFVNSIIQRDFFSAFKGLLTIQKRKIALLKAEKEIQGRELGYIFSANKHFS